MTSHIHGARPRRQPNLKGIAAGALCLGLLLAGCETTSSGSTSQPGDGRQIIQPPQARSRDGLTPPFMAGRSITRFGVLLPFSAIPQESQALYDAAELALFEQANPALLLIPRDSGTSASQAASSTNALAKDGVELIIGPLVRDSVLGARDPARRADVPLISFSNDRVAAGNGAYLLSFQSEEEVQRVIAFAAGQSVRRIAILAPDTEYGRRVEIEARRIAPLSGAQIVASQLYTPTENGAAAGAQALARAAIPSGVQAVFIPGDGPSLRAAASALSAAGLDPNRVKLLGIGSWGLNTAFREPVLAGAWVAAPDPAARRGFERRFKAAYGREPSRLASLAYDAVTLAAQIALNPAQDARAQLERPQGFQGVDGLFRFRPNGSIQRALPIFRIEANGAAVLLEPALRAFPPSDV